MCSGRNTDVKYMYPTLLSIGIFHFHSYTAMMAISFLVGVLMPIRENYRLKKPYPVTPIAGIWVFVGGLVGARVYYILQYDDWRHLYYAVFFWQGGLVFFGGLIGGTAACIAYLKWKRIPIPIAADFIAPAIPLAHAIGRVGCFLNGCCWGAPTELSWGVCYPHSPWGAFARQLKDGIITNDAAATVPVHPTQLYAAAGLLVVFAVVRYAYKHKRHDGSVMLLYVLLYGALRFGLEFLRGDSARPSFGMTVSQVLALAAAAAAASLLILLYATVWRAKPEAESSTVLASDGANKDTDKS